MTRDGTRFYRCSACAALCLLVSTMAVRATAPDARQPAPERPIKVFILAGDDNVLEQAPITGATAGFHARYWLNPEPVTDEPKQHVNCMVYAERWDQETDFDPMTPVATGIVEIGEQRTKRIYRKKKGRGPVPFTPFPDESDKEDHTTVLRGYLSVPCAGRYLIQPGTNVSAFNVTHVDGKEVYRCWGSYNRSSVTAIQLEANKRYPFKTVFCYKPGHAFRVSLLNKPGTLRTVVSQNKDYDFLTDERGVWTTRDDVVLYDMHPVHNNDKSPGRFLGVGDVSYGGRRIFNAVGPELMLGHVLGEHFDDPVLLLRFASRGRKSLAHDFCPPSSNGGTDMDGSWDVIHFNWGMWDIARRNPRSTDWAKRDKINGEITTPIDVYEKNLRTLVARMKKTGATLIWGSTTPVHKDCIGSFQKDSPRYNAVAAKIMKENGVIINDLYAESLRQGYPKRPNVHSVGNLAPKVIEAVQAALASRKTNNTPLPRVLVIGDSISSTYYRPLANAMKGKAYVRHNPGNGEHTGTGLARIEQWLDLKTYGQKGQEYVELKNAVQWSLANLERVYPGYAGQQAELSGCIWFQGIRDASSPNMAAEYKKHLPNLIRDIRSDLNAPKLPVVVPAFGAGGTAMDTTETAVFSAQMAIDSTPEFKGNVISVDTRTFFPAPERSPTRKRANYYNNANSFLGIGEAIGKAMLELTPGRE